MMSLPTSPKSKSAPATPCNVTPTDFHQHNSHPNAMLHPSPANTLPIDIRKNISATCRVLPSSIGASNDDNNNININLCNLDHGLTLGSQYLDDLIKEGQSLLESNNYVGAITSFSQCIDLAKTQNFQYLQNNFKVFSQRAKAHIELGNYNETIEDSIAARELNPKWTEAYFLQGQAQFCIGQHAEALAAFSAGLTQDPSNEQLFEALIEVASKSSFKQDFETKLNALKKMGLDKKPFVVVSIVGQELLSQGQEHTRVHAAVILESALKLEPDNNRFKASLLSSIGCVYYLMKDYDNSINYMLQELELESELEDVNSQCRVLSNLGYTYYKMRKFDKSLESHRKHLTLAMRSHLFQQASIALNAIGHVHVAKSDYTSALTSHTRCLEILRQLDDNEFNQFRELLSIGHVNCMLNDFKAAEEKYQEAIQLIENGSKINREEGHNGLIMVYFDMAFLALKRKSYSKAKYYYEVVIHLAQQIPNQTRRLMLEMRALNGLGHTYRLIKKFDEAREFYAKQLRLAKVLNDTLGQSQALCNLGMTCQHFKEYKDAWKYFDTNSQLVDKDPLLKAYALSYIGSMYFLENRYNEAHAKYESSMNLFNELDYCSAEKKSIDLNLAALNERMGSLTIGSSDVATELKRVVIT